MQELPILVDHDVLKVCMLRICEGRPRARVEEQPREEERISKVQRRLPREVVGS